MGDQLERDILPGLFIWMTEMEATMSCQFLMVSSTLVRLQQWTEDGETLLQDACGCIISRV